MKKTALFLGSFAVVSVSLWQSGVNAAPWSRKHHAALCSSGGTIATKAGSTKEVVGISLGATSRVYCPLILDNDLGIDVTDLSLVVHHNPVKGARLHVCFTFTEQGNGNTIVSGARCTADRSSETGEGQFEIISQPFGDAPPRPHEMPYLAVMGSVDGQKVYSFTGYELRAE